jgi:hypothetical protein
MPGSFLPEIIGPCNPLKKSTLDDQPSGNFGNAGAFVG